MFCSVPSPFKNQLRYQKCCSI